MAVGGSSPSCAPSPGRKASTARSSASVVHEGVERIDRAGWRGPVVELPAARRTHGSHADASPARARPPAPIAARTRRTRGPRTDSGPVRRGGASTTSSSAPAPSTSASEKQRAPQDSPHASPDASTTSTPASSTSPGSTPATVASRRRACCSVSTSGDSGRCTSGTSFARSPASASSPPAHATALSATSRLPSTSRYASLAKSESPTTTSRPRRAPSPPPTSAITMTDSGPGTSCAAFDGSSPRRARSASAIAHAEGAVRAMLSAATPGTSRDHVHRARRRQHHAALDRVLRRLRDRVAASELLDHRGEAVGAEHAGARGRRRSRRRARCPCVAEERLQAGQRARVEEQQQAAAGLQVSGRASPAPRAGSRASAPRRSPGRCPRAAARRAG